MKLIETNIMQTYIEKYRTIILVRMKNKEDGNFKKKQEKQNGE